MSPAPAARGRRTPATLLAASGLVALVLLVPLVFLLIEAGGAGLRDVAGLIWRPLTGMLLWNTVRLMVVVTALSAVIGTLTAWCVERTDLPGRRVWAVLVVVPFAIPDFVVSFGWVSLTTWVQGYGGAILVMTLAVYPLVYLPVAASLRAADPGQEEIARSLGVGRVRTFLRVTLGQARSAIFGGCILVAFILLAEYGAFEILGYRTFTTEIFSEFQVFDIPTACALSLVLVVLGIVVLGGDFAVRGRGRVAQVARPASRHRLGRATVPVVAAFALLVLLALGVPVGASIYWVFEGGAHAIAGVSIFDAGWHTAVYSGVAALLATVAALPVAMLSVRHPGRGGQLLERSTYLVLAMPGVVIAFALSYFSERYAGGLGYQSAPLLILAYAILFFPLAYVGVRAAVARAPSALDDVGRSLGIGRLGVLARVTLPLIGPGVAAAFCLVFLAAVTELTATLLLIPTGVQTLATQFWAYEQNLSYGQAAPFALVIIGLAAVPSYVVSRYFDRSPSR
ncbi:MAG: iron ABC transporter permease [Actinomycetota bacterium]|nr:iron ABC transporter permease [Actinomycetota bacterium]